MRGYLFGAIFMKLLKKILLLGAMLSTLAGFGAVASACDQTGGGNSLSDGSYSQNDGSDDTSDSSGEEVSNAFVYRVSVKNTTGFGFSKITVNLMQGDEIVASKKTMASGNANFLEDDIAAGEYTVQLENIPVGYVLEEPDRVYKTSTDAGTTTTVVIKPTGMLTGEAPQNTKYSLGSVVYDATMTLATGKTYTLSEVLAEKKMILVNFWATWCGPCKSEFPAMHNAVSARESDVSVLAISTTDGKDAVYDFQFAENNYEKFNMAASGSGNLANLFGVAGQNASIPHSFIIDRYGVVVYDEVGSITSANAFLSLFDRFTGEDYESTVLGSGNVEEDDGNQGGVIEQIKPTVEAPKPEEIKTAFADSSASGFAFRFQEKDENGDVLLPDSEQYDEYNWPWVVGEGYIKPSNANIHNSYSILYATMTAKAGDVLTFDYKVGSELDCDILYVMLDKTVVKKYSGNNANAWLTDWAYVFTADEVGEHEIAFMFVKDSESTHYEDVVQLKNLRIIPESDLDSPSVSANIFRNAATVRNENGATQYKNYITPVYNANDQYYHVGNENGPVLYANMLNSSLWNRYSVWELAYNDYIVGNGVNYHTLMEDFAWEAAQVTTVSGYTPVTKDLRSLLDAAVKYCTFEQNWKGAYHENEWLELCVYWQHYGQTELPADPMASITFTAAIAMHASAEGCAHTTDCTCANEVNVLYNINPRGFKYKFIPEKSGAYKVYSTGSVNSQAFLLDSDRKTHLGFWDNKVFVETIEDSQGNLIADNNFEFYWYFEEGKTYYILFATYLDMTATYDVYIDYLGATYTYLENAAVGPYSANLNTFELFLPDAIEYTYYDETDDGVDNGFYYHKLADGSRGGKIYLDVNRPTAFFNTAVSLYDICRDAEKNYNTPESIPKRALYIDGVDYTDDFFDICYEACGVPKTDPYYGFAVIDKELFDLLQTIILSTKYDGIETSWLLLCYYEKTLAPVAN